MGIEAIALGALAASAIGAGVSAYQAKRQGDAADAAGKRQAQLAEQERLRQEEEFNRANRKKADVSGLLQANTGGSGSPNLTGGSAGTGTLGAGGMLGR